MDQCPEDCERTDFGTDKPEIEDQHLNQTTSDTSHTLLNISPADSEGIEEAGFIPQNANLHLIGNKKKHLVKSVMRQLRKSSKFCLNHLKSKISLSHPKAAYKRRKTSSDTQTTASDDRFQNLYTLFLSLYSQNAEEKHANLFEAIIQGVSLMNAKAKDEKEAKYCKTQLEKGGFSKKNQKKLLEEDDVRKFYYCVMRSLENFKRDGNAIQESLGLKGEYDSEEVRSYIYFGYICNLGFCPFDGKAFLPLPPIQPSPASSESHTHKKKPKCEPGDDLLVDYFEETEKNVPITLIRSLKKYAEFAFQCSIHSFAYAFKCVQKKHKSTKPAESTGHNKVRKRATDDTRCLFEMLWNRAKNIPPSISQRQFFENIVNNCKKRDRSMSWQSQSEIFQEKQVREFYDLVLQFMDNFDDNGVELKTVMRMQGEPESVKQQLFVGYLSYLDLDQVRNYPPDSPTTSP